MSRLASARARLRTGRHAALRVLTPAGRALALLGLSSWVLGVGLDWLELRALGLACLVALGLAVPLALVPRPGRASVVARPARTVAGTPIHGVLRVSAGRLPAVSPAVEVGGLVGRSMRLATIRPGRPREEVFEVPAQRRGVYELGPVRLVQSDPLGLVRRHRTWARPTEVLVRPVVTPLEAGSMAGRPDLEGMPSEQLSLSDLAFHSLREYVPGDDLRHVHWRSSAKADQLLVRQYLESRSMQAAVLLDAEPGSYRTDDEFELAVSIAASVAVQALADGVHVTLTCGAFVVEAESPDALLDACCRLVTDGSLALESAAARAGSRDSLAGAVYAVTGSGRTQHEVLRALTAFPLPSARVVLRAVPDGRDAQMTSPAARLADVTSLDRLPRLVAGVTP